MTIQEFESLDHMLKGQQPDVHLALVMLDRLDMDVFGTALLYKQNIRVFRKKSEEYPKLHARLIPYFDPRTTLKISFDELITLVKTDDDKILFKHIFEKIVVQSIKIGTGITIVPHFIIDYDQQGR